MAYCREIISEGRSMRLPATNPRLKPNRGEVPHIVIVGGGVAGIILATRLGRLLGRRGRARVSLIDRSWIHVWKPMLHTFAAGTWNIYQQQVQFVTHALMHHFEYIPGQLDAIDRTARRIRLAPLQADSEVLAGTRELVYDVLVLAFGSRANDFGTPGVASTASSSTARTKPTPSTLGCARTWYAASRRAATSTLPSLAAAPLVWS